MAGKGISVLVASVLTVAFTVAISMMVMVWFNGFVNTTTHNVSSTAGESIECASGAIEIEHIYINKATHDASITVKNMGRINLTSNAMMVNTTGGSCRTTISTFIEKGKISSLILNNSDCFINQTTFSKAIVTTTCGGVADSTTSVDIISFV